MLFVLISLLSPVTYNSGQLSSLITTKYYMPINSISIQYKLDRSKWCNSSHSKVTSIVTDSLCGLPDALGVQMRVTANNMIICSQRGFWVAHAYRNFLSNYLLHSAEIAITEEGKLHLSVLLMTWHNTRTDKSSNPGQSKLTILKPGSILTREKK